MYAFNVHSFINLFACNTKTIAFYYLWFGWFLYMLNWVDNAVPIVNSLSNSFTVERFSSNKWLLSIIRFYSTMKKCHYSFSHSCFEPALFLYKFIFFFVLSLNSELTTVGIDWIKMYSNNSNGVKKHSLDNNLQYDIPTSIIFMLFGLLTYC